ncbi:MAG: hypothetical protein HQ501_07800 [Rhodospirillales bacterium]|nr:hypothetical protein [Rhodospirillales bacterium]
MADEADGIPADLEDKVEAAEEVISLEDDIMSSPLFILVTLMAYIAECGGREIPIEQKSVFLAILRKHVNKNEIEEKELHLMLRDAFNLTLRIEFPHYLESVTPALTMGQRFSVIANLYNMMMVDGEIRDGEEARIDLCRRKFGLDPRIARQIRRVSLLRNDTSIFLNPNHPCNDPAFSFHLDHS